MKLTRREVAAWLAAGPALAQAPEAIPRNPEEELKAAVEQMRANSQRLAATAVPITAEPAFQFKA